MLPSKRAGRERTMLLAVVAVASGVTICCSEPAGIGLYNPGWDAAFEAAAKDASNDAVTDAPVDGASDSAADASDDAPDDAGNASDAVGD